MSAPATLDPAISRVGAEIVADSRRSPPRMLAVLRAASIIAAELAANSAHPAAALNTMLGELGRNAHHLMNKEIHQ